MIWPCILMIMIITRLLSSYCPIRNTKNACQKHFWPQIEKDLVCDVFVMCEVLLFLF